MLMKVVNCDYCDKIESVELANQIRSQLIDMTGINDNHPLVLNMNDDLNLIEEQQWSSITFGQNYHENIIGQQLEFYHLQSVQFMGFKSDSFKQYSSVTISDLGQLKVLIFDSVSCRDVKSLTLTSMIIN